MNHKEHKNEPASWLKRFFRKLKGNGDSSLRESLEEVIEEYENAGDEEPLGIEGREMLMNVLKYNEQRAVDIMVPRADIGAFNVAGSFSDLVETFRKDGHSRLPIYRGSLDDVIGMVHVKDVMQVLGGKETNQKPPALEDIIRDVIVVPPSMRLIDLLKRMKTQRTHMAIVVDEYGGADGLVTIEDLVEQIVGEIEDEYDETSEPALTFIGAGVYEADARVEIDELEKVLGADFLSDALDETVNTLGGLVFTLEGRVPEIGEVLDHAAGFKFEIIDADPRRIKRVRIHLPKKPKG
ncbi:MAG: hemolysin family protein [Alphaproteobacteria bacterium]